MSVQAPPKPSKVSALENAPLTPPDEKFWKRYSPHYEFPLANVASVAIHIVVFGLFLYYISRLLNPTDDKTAPPVRGMMVIDSDSGDGIGSPGSGGGHQEAKEKDERPQEVRQPLEQAELKREMIAVSAWAPELKDNPEALEAIANSPNKERFDKHNDNLKKRMLGLGEKTGAGTEDGNSRANQPGKGDGGVGDATSSTRRQSRWVLIFRTENGSDYLAQLGSLKAQVIVPTANGRYILIKDLTDLKDRKDISEQEIPVQFMSFVDDNKDSVKRVAETLGLDYSPKLFIAVVPKDVENDLAAKERGYRNRKETDIHSTTFRVLVRDGKYTVTVIDQQVNRK